MVNLGFKCIKYLMFIFNFLFLICGIALIVTGAIACQRNYTEFMSTRYLTGPVILIIVGIVIFFVSFLGCCGAIKQNQCMLVMFGIIMLAIFIVELAAGISAFVYKPNIKMFLKENMDQSFIQQNTDTKRYWDDLQSELKCCGVNGSSDYVTHQFDIPKSCCPSYEETCDYSHTYHTGCFDSLYNQLTKAVGIVGGVAIGLGVIELLGCMFSWCLAFAYKHDYITV